MMRISDKQILSEIEARAVVHGWGNRRRISREALRHICRRHQIASDDACEDLAGRVDRIWAEQAGIQGVA